TKAPLDGVQKRLFALRRHRRILVGARRGQIAGGKKEHGRVIPEILGIEDLPVFGSGHFETMLLPESGDRRFHDAGMAINSLYDIVLPPGRLGKNKEGLFLRCQQLLWQGQSGSENRTGTQKLTAVHELTHVLSFPSYVVSSITLLFHCNLSRV